MKRPVTILSGLLLLVMLALGTQLAVKCSEDPPAWSAVPEGFVDTPTSTFPFRAVAPDGTVIAIRERANNEEGDLAYWAEVFELEMTEGKGYRLNETVDITSTDGVPGKLLRFEVAHDEVPFAYQLGLFVTDKAIITVEAGVERARLDRYEAAFDEVRSNLNTQASFYHRQD